MTEQVDIAVDLGAVPPPLPEIVTLRQFALSPPTTPPQIIEGILHQGCKMVLGGTNKSRCLLDLALSVVSDHFTTRFVELVKLALCLSWRQGCFPWH